ncbi:hypothetical protein [Actinoplanes awajinensis]|uniref:hypothetical protein n=1 Tax=Actinoplanes awajinensis TaxID=135946 RepID=UPI000AF51DE2|nr:hypothetical protein [Actinoplanes awajinensis]
MSATLFDHALRLHRLTPDAPLPRDGDPYPDADDDRPDSGDDRRRRGIDAAAVLDRHFADPTAQPGDLTGAFRAIDVPIHLNDHITAAALRADRDRVRATGRHLVRHSTDRNSATVGLALLAADWTGADIPLIQTIGLLSNHFGPLAAHALQRRRGGGEALLWLAQRVAGWGRVYVVEALLPVGISVARDWLLRHSCDGDFLNGYFAGRVAVAADLHTAIVAADPDDELIDHTGRLLCQMAAADGMGQTLRGYPAAPIVLAAFADHLGGQSPSSERFVQAAVLVNQLDHGGAGDLGTDPEGRIRVVLDRPEWCAAVQNDLDLDDDYAAWFTEHVGERLGLRAFTPPGG